MFYPAPSVQLMGFARSRRNPVRKTLAPLNRWLMLADEQVLWRFGKRADPRADILPLIEAEIAQLAVLSAADFAARLAEKPISASALRQPTRLAKAMALVLEVMRRHLGFALRHTQIGCALALLRGDCVEMRTGEGKTLAAGLAAMVAARAGVATHVITVNDYLARRDHGQMLEMAAQLGISSAVLLQDMSDDDKRAAYDVDLLYGTNKTFVFDHLRDLREARQNAGKVPRQMGQAFGIIDEADSVLIDDATVPMILSEPAGPLPDADLRLFSDLCAFASALPEGSHRTRDNSGSWRMTPAAVDLLARFALGWSHPVAQTEDLIHLADEALSAQFNFRAGETYLVQDGKIVLIDQSTGRLMPDRRWGYGMHQFVEIKEGLTPSQENRTVGQVTQQSFFRQYRILAGLTGTAAECRGEFWAVYRLPITPIAPHVPPKLQNYGLKLCRTAQEKNALIVQRAISLAATRAVLIGVNDVIEAAALAQSFADLGRDVAVLDAQAEQNEAELVAGAGVVGRITIATHLAGRGTDIALQGDLRENGGLHVIIGSAMASARLERQLFGRAARQGDPGSYEVIIGLQDRGLRDGAQSAQRRILMALLQMGFAPALMLRLIQAQRDALARRARKSSLLREQDISRQLGYR
jgi:preprotein translocase subunit SecA